MTYIPRSLACLLAGYIYHDLGSRKIIQECIGCPCLSIFLGSWESKHVSKDCLGTSKCTKHRCMSTRPSPQHIPAWPTQLPLEYTLCTDCIDHCFQTQAPGHSSLFYCLCIHWESFQMKPLGSLLLIHLQGNSVHERHTWSST